MPRSSGFRGGGGGGASDLAPVFEVLGPVSDPAPVFEVRGPVIGLAPALDQITVQVPTVGAMGMGDHMVVHITIIHFIAHDIMEVITGDPIELFIMGEDIGVVPIGTIICMIIFFVIIMMIISTSFVSNVVTNSNEITLQPGGTKMVSIDSSKTDLEVSATSSITTYFFSSQPSLTESSSDAYSESSILMYSNAVEAYYIYMNPGSTIEITWDIAAAVYDVEFYILKGESEYDDFMADNYFDYELYEGYEGTSHFTADEADTYYFTWWNFGNSYSYLDINLDYILLDYDLSGASSSELGSFDQSVSQYNYVVFENSASSEVSVDYDFTSPGLSSLNLQSVVPLIIVIIGVIAIIRVVSKSKKQTPKQATAATGIQTTTAASQPSRTPLYNPISAPNTTTPLYGQKTTSSTPSGGFTMSSRASSPSNQTYTTAPKSYVANKKFTQHQKDTIEELFKYSNRVFLYDVAARLRLSRDDLIALSRNDPDGFKGYRIDGEYLEAVGVSSNSGSSASGYRYCEVCGNPLDQPSMDRLNKMGSVFCGYCGKKMQR